MSAMAELIISTMNCAKHLFIVKRC